MDVAILIVADISRPRNGQFFGFGRLRYPFGKTVSENFKNFVSVIPERCSKSTRR